MRPSFTCITALMAVAAGCLSATALAGSSVRLWYRSLDDLADYELTGASIAWSVRFCVAEASEAARLVTFNVSDGVCREYQCRMGQTDCRKCRNTNGSQVVWIPGPHADHCWVTVQHRVSDSVDFYRNWSEYKAGFGEGPSGNFWLGLDALRSLAASSSIRVRFVMKTWNGTEGWAEYSNVTIGPESDNYRLNLSGSFSSSESGDWDCLTGYSGQAFSTMDRNNDVCGNRAYNCAYQFHGAWWFKCCSKAFPNGRYYQYPAALDTTSYNGVIWTCRFGSKYSLMEFEMLVCQLI